ncbi:MAG: cytochrome c [Betaproteobacteria bacterium]
MRRSNSTLAAAALLLLTVSGAALAADLVAARARAQALCENCHGLNGVATLTGAANLSGQQKEYLREQLRAFRAGRRQNEQMSVIAKLLSDAEIENLSEWYASIKVTVEMPN